MIFGYSEKQLNEYGLLEMKEVTFSTSSETLRKISYFLNEAATLIDNGSFDKNSHIHIQNIIPDWDDCYPNRNIIVCSSSEKNL